MISLSWTVSILEPGQFQNWENMLEIWYLPWEKSDYNFAVTGMNPYTNSWIEESITYLRIWEDIGGDLRQTD